MKINISSNWTSLQQSVMATSLSLSTLSLSSEKSEEEEAQEERVAPTTWRDIPAELKAMMLCSDCALPAYDVENPVVLTCAHILCMKCLTQKWNSMTPTAKVEETIECPTKMCNEIVHSQGRYTGLSW